MDKNRDEKGKFIKGHKINIGRKHDFISHTIKNIEAFRKMRSEKMKENKINLGRKWPEEVKRKISEVKKGTYTGKKNSNWKGGVSFNYRQGYAKQHKIWAKAVLKRDNYKCLVCKKVNGRLNAHHIKFWKEHPKLRFDVDNGITLCDKCHILEHKKVDKIMVGN